MIKNIITLVSSWRSHISKSTISAHLIKHIICCTSYAVPIIIMPMTKLPTTEPWPLDPKVLFFWWIPQIDMLKLIEIVLSSPVLYSVIQVLCHSYIIVNFIILLL